MNAQRVSSSWRRPRGALILLLIGGLLAGFAESRREESGAAGVHRGDELYRAHCALCHGERGRADGPAAHLLFPQARDFTRGAFKLTSTENGVPTERDFVATLRRGIPGSAMPSWSWMPEGDLRALAGHVRSRAVEGVARRLALELGDTSEGLHELAVEHMTPGPPIDVGTPAPVTLETLQLGRELYLESCARCHGEDGRGRRDVVRNDEDGVLNWARDFTAGIMKGGASHAELARRLGAGLHGTAMPAWSMALEDRSALIAYVRSLIPSGAEHRLVQARQFVRAWRVADVERESWRGAPEVPIVLAPLWWRDGAVLEAQISAVHDGATLAVRIRWDDARPDVPEDLRQADGRPRSADAVALQLCALSNPSFFGMGEGVEGTNMWHWRALHLIDAESFQLLPELLPHRIGARFTEADPQLLPLHQPALGTLQVLGRTTATLPAGMRATSRWESVPSPIGARSIWDEGVWEVVLTRRLEPSSERELVLRPGTRVSMNLAIWNGEICDRRGQKSVTIWHTLALEP